MLTLTADIHTFDWKPFVLQKVEDKKFVLKKDEIMIDFILIGDNLLLKSDSHFLNEQEINLKLSLYKFSYARVKSILMEYLINDLENRSESKNEEFSNLFLSHEKIYYKFPLNQSELFQNSDKTTTKVISHLKNNLNTSQIKEIIFKEMKSFNTNKSYSHYLEPHSLFDFKVHLFNQEKEIIFNVNLNSQHYPYAPPQISWISPRISLQKLSDLYDCEIFSKKWNPTINLEWLFLELNKIFIEKEYYSDNSSFGELEKEIINLIKLNNLLTSETPIKLDYSLIELGTVNTKNNYWKSGTGYGNHSSTKWSIEEYLTEANLITESQIKILENIKNNFNQDIFDKLSEEIKNKLYQIMNDEIKELNLLELEKKHQYYFELFSLILLLNNYQDKINFESIEDLKESTENLPEIPSKLEIIIPIINQIKVNKVINNQIENQSYQELMKPLLFNYVEINKDTKYHYHNKNGKPSSSKQTIRLAQDISAIRKSLPCNQESTIWVRWDKEHMTKMQFIISGPKDTPYQDALFLFDTYFPPEYPTSPPQINLQTTGGGKVRFNPNLYHCGKVCLSLLGTWNGEGGEKWNERTSTLLQILVSIQSLILVEEPYFNEPGYEKNINTKQGKDASFAYNDERRWQSIKYGVLEMIKNPPKGFEEIVKIHFQQKLPEIKTTLEKWKLETKKYQKEFQHLEDELNKLNFDI